MYIHIHIHRCMYMQSKTWLGIDTLLHILIHLLMQKSHANLHVSHDVRSQAWHRPGVALRFGVKHVLQQQARRRNGRRRPQHALHVRQRVRGGSGRRRGHGGLRRGHAGGRSTAGHVVGAREAGHQLRARRAGHLQAMAICDRALQAGLFSWLIKAHHRLGSDLPRTH